MIVSHDAILCPLQLRDFGLKRPILAILFWANRQTDLFCLQVGMRYDSTNTDSKQTHKYCFTYIALRCFKML